MNNNIKENRATISSLRFKENFSFFRSLKLFKEEEVLKPANVVQKFHLRFKDFPPTQKDNKKQSFKERIKNIFSIEGKKKRQPVVCLNRVSSTIQKSIISTAKRACLEKKIIFYIHWLFIDLI